MATLTVNQLARQLLTENGTSLSDLNYISQVEVWINDIYKDILSRENWRWRRTSETINTVASTAEYSLAATACTIRAARLGTSYDQPLAYITIKELSDQGLDLELTGQPIYIYESSYSETTQKRAISLWPIPDAVYPVIVYEELKASDLVSAATIPIPEEMYGILRHGVRQFLYREDREYESAQLAQVDYENGLKHAKRLHALVEADSIMGEYIDVPQTADSPIRLNRYPKFF